MLSDDKFKDVYNRLMSTANSLIEEFEDEDENMHLVVAGVLTTMGSGMGVALYTTLSALVTGVLIAIQYYNLESGCEELFAVLNQISEVSIDSSL